MFFRILGETFYRRKAKVALVLLAVATGAFLASALLGTLIRIEERVAGELRAYGANILVTIPSDQLTFDIAGVRLASGSKQSYISEADLVRLKTIFWRNNILGFAPFLSVPIGAGVDRQPAVLTGTWFEREIQVPKGSAIRTGFAEEQALAQSTVAKVGVKAMSPWWHVEGSWPREGDYPGALVGAKVAQSLGVRLGDTFPVTFQDQGRLLRVEGILYTGSLEEDQIYVGLPLVQGLLGIPWGADRVLVSALTQPRSKLPPDIRNKDLGEMTPKEYEKWYCTATLEAIITQIEEVLPGAVAKPVLQISEGEEMFATKMRLLVLLIAAVSLVGSGLAVAASMTTSVLERKTDIGLMKAVGADSGQVAVLFLAEAVVLGLAGGLLGYALGWVGARVLIGGLFGASLPFDLSTFLLTMFLALSTAILGSLGPVRQALGQPPVQLLSRRGL